MCSKADLQNILAQVQSKSQKIYGTQLNRIILYGSYARGDNTNESDVDIMIILDCSSDDVKKMRGITSEMASDISLEQGVFLSILLRDKKHFDEAKGILPFYQNIEREGVAVYG